MDRHQSSAPTLFFYGAICLAILGIGNGIGWLTVIGVLIAAAFYLPLAIGSFQHWLRFERAKRHPERYRMLITEDTSGNPVGVSWKQVR